MCDIVQKFPNNQMVQLQLVCGSTSSPNALRVSIPVAVLSVLVMATGAASFNRSIDTAPDWFVLEMAKRLFPNARADLPASEANTAGPPTGEARAGAFGPDLRRWLGAAEADRGAGVRSQVEGALP